MKIKQSETVTIKRSQVSFAAYNPRKKNQKVIDKLKANFKKVGFLGGIVWNERTGNIVGGHKRVETLDVIFDYAGGNDYDIKVEKIDVDDKTEKEQNIFLNSKSAQGEMDYDMLAELIPDIDVEAASISDYEIKMIEAMNPNFDMGDNSGLHDAANELKQRTDEQKAATKENRKNMRQDTTEKRMPFYFTITFDSYNEKASFLEKYGINGDSVFVTSEQFINAIENE